MTCDYCLEGNEPIDGWHVYPDFEGIWGPARIPCADNPPKQPGGDDADPAEPTAAD